MRSEGSTIREQNLPEQNFAHSGVRVQASKVEKAHVTPCVDGASVFSLIESVGQQQR